jgi:fatty acid desaturase
VNNAAAHSIPAKLNLVLCFGTGAGLLLILGATARAESMSAILGLTLLYGILMNTGYALIHESEHGIFHPNHLVNLWGGVVLALFFPAPFHLIRQGHIGHHQRNRSDDEAFDFYFAGESRLWRWLQLYGILTGFFWMTIALGNLVCAVSPALLRRPATPFDRSTAAFQDSLNPKYDQWIRLEAIAAIALHVSLILLFGTPPVRHLIVLMGFGFLWSAMQYAHHFGTAREVLHGARNLKTFPLLDKIWLNHNWHLNHHLRPTVPWIYLPGLFHGAQYEERGSLLRAYFFMWRGPRFSEERVENRYTDRVIR